MCERHKRLWDKRTGLSIQMKCDANAQFSDFALKEEVQADETRRKTKSNEWKRVKSKDYKDHR